VEDYARLVREDRDGKPLAGIRIGLPAEYFGAGIDAEVARAIEEALAVLRTLGAQTVGVALPNVKLAIPVYYVIAPAEASSNLSRFDGVRYGHRAAAYTDLTDMYAKTRGEGFGAEVKRRILVGTYVLSHGYYDAYYLKAQQVRRLIAETFAPPTRSATRSPGRRRRPRVQDRGEERRSRPDVFERHFHDRRQPDWRARALDSLRLRPQRPADRPAASGSRVHGSDAARHRAPVSAGDRLA
jgi:hypothetical protein